MRKGYLANLEAGLLAEDNTEVTSVVDGESVLEEISNGCEDIIPDGYTEIDGEMTVTENLTDAIEEEEAIMEEVELPMVEAGAESDFNANVLNNEITVNYQQEKSNILINIKNIKSQINYSNKKPTQIKP